MKIQLIVGNDNRQRRLFLWGFLKIRHKHLKWNTVHIPTELLFIMFVTWFKWMIFFTLSDSFFFFWSFCFSSPTFVTIKISLNNRILREWVSWDSFSEHKRRPSKENLRSACSKVPISFSIFRGIFKSCWIAMILFILAYFSCESSTDWAVSLTFRQASPKLL